MGTFTVIERPGPVVTTAIHAGHGLRPEVASALKLSDEERLREEDPFTDLIADIGATLVVVEASRFQIDLNRPREAAVYRTPEQAWGLDLWAEQPGPRVVARSLAEYDAFYERVGRLLGNAIEEHEHVLLVDVHSYNHRRGGPDAPHDAEDANPEINIGTGSLDRTLWAGVVDALESSFDMSGYDARENVKFRGGRFPVWANTAFPGQVCAIAIEFKKTFMDEWSGEMDRQAVDRARVALADAVEQATLELRGVVG